MNNNNNNWYLYYLIDPRNEKPFYVGISSRDKDVRLTEHKRPKERTKNFLKYMKIREIKSAGLDVQIKIIEDNLTKQEAESKEITAIALLKAAGIVLTNISLGGNVYIPTPEVREKISAAKKGQPSYVRTEEHKQRMSESLKGHNVADETKEKIRKANTGKKLSEETKTLMSKVRTGVKKTEEHREKLAIICKENGAKTAKKIQQWVEGKLIAEYDSLREAARAGHNRVSIQTSLKENRRLQNGIHWKYSKD
jgi:hypothetical protein